MSEEITRILCGPGHTLRRIELTNLLYASQKAIDHAVRCQDEDAWHKAIREHNATIAKARIEGLL